MKLRRVVSLCSVVALFVLAAPARADVVHLKNGSRLEGEVSVEGDGVRVKLSFGSVWLPSKEVASVERTVRAPAPVAAPVAAPAPAPVAPVARVRRASDLQLTAQARAVEAAFERGDQAAAATLLASSSIRRFDETQGVDVTAAFDGELSLTVHRDQATGPIAVVFPPGTYGEPRGRSGVQDLTLLRAPVLVLPADASEATVRVPVACATYTAGGPRHGQSYALTRFAADSPMERLMQALCVGERAPAPEEAQLAVWIVANGIKSTDLRHAHSFGGGLVTEAHTSGAVCFLRAAALSPDDYAFFNRTVEERAPNVVDRVAEPTRPVPVRPRPEVEVDLLDVPEFPAPVLPPVTP